MCPEKATKDFNVVYDKINKWSNGTDRRTTQKHIASSHSYCRCRGQKMQLKLLIDSQLAQRHKVVLPYDLL